MTREGGYRPKHSDSAAVGCDVRTSGRHRPYSLAQKSSQNLSCDEIEREVRGQGWRWKRLGGVLKYVENLFRQQRRATGFAADRSRERFWDDFWLFRRVLQPFGK
jgi:hypothetical protein